MNNQAMGEAQALVTTLLTCTEVVCQGVASIERLRDAIALMSKMAGFHIELAPDIEPGILDLLGIAGPKMLVTAAAGAVFGAAVASSVDRSKQGAAIGAGVGAIIGLVLGIAAINEGWRVRARYRPNGVLYIGQI